VLRIVDRSRHDVAYVRSFTSTLDRESGPRALSLDRREIAGRVT
jgi:hypothetical protein